MTDLRNPPLETERKMTDLKPCPFCGSEAERPRPNDPHGGMVQCVSCGASAFGPKWNRRAKPEELVEALTMVRDADEDCRKDGLPTIPTFARSLIDAAISKAGS